MMGDLGLLFSHREPGELCGMAQRQRSPLPGTGSSNPSPSSGESTTNRAAGRPVLVCSPCRMMMLSNTGLWAASYTETARCAYPIHCPSVVGTSGNRPRYMGTSPVTLLVASAAFGSWPFSATAVVCGENRSKFGTPETALRGDAIGVCALQKLRRDCSPRRKHHVHSRREPDSFSILYRGCAVVDTRP